jgi:hypothetical protein
MFAVALLLLWAVHNGGYDADTWYWGALVMLAMVAGTIAFSVQRPNIGRRTVVALSAFTLYVAWSYLSIAWAQSPGDALQGSNRALLYLLVFALMALLPWTAEAALATLLTFVLGVGVISIVLLTRLASEDHVGALVIGGRLAAPTGYFNATAALFTINALVAIALAARRELPAPLRGALTASACAGLELALIVQSRGWLFTLPLIAIVGLFVVRDRLRVAAAAALPLIGALAPLRRLLDVFKDSGGSGLAHAAGRAGQSALLICGAMLVAATLIAWGEELLDLPPLSKVARRRIGAGVASLAIVVAAAGGVVATHGHPIRFISRQWNGFSHVQTSFSSQSHFSDVGSGRYDFWRVSLDAFAAHPLGGLGQDNFADYYVVHRHTAEEPAWTHSLELRLLAETGLVGFLLFAVFLVAAVAGALSARRRTEGLAPAVAAAALLPLIVWVIHGSVDWFWEMPALSGPALGFLGMAVALGERGRSVVWRRDRPRRLARGLRLAAAVGMLTLAIVALGFPYISVREVSEASDIAGRDPAAALRDLATAADLNPLSADPGRLGGTIALQSGQYATAEARFDQAIDRERQGWFAWFGAGLAASSLGERARAHHDLLVAERINSRQPAITEALARVYSRHPLPADQALRAIVLAP